MDGVADLSNDHIQPPVRRFVDREEPDQRFPGRHEAARRDVNQEFFDSDRESEHSPVLRGTLEARLQRDQRVLAEGLGYLGDKQQLGDPFPVFGVGVSVPSGRPSASVRLDMVTSSCVECRVEPAFMLPDGVERLAGPAPIAARETSIARHAHVREAVEGRHWPIGLPESLPPQGAGAWAGPATCTTSGYASSFAVRMGASSAANDA